MVWCCFWPCGQTSPQVYAGLAADESAASSRLIAGSQPECLRHSRRKKSLAGQKNGRHFAVRRKTGIFPAKSAFSCFRTHGKRNCPSAISTPRLGLSDNPPAGLSRECACRWRQRKKRPCALQPHEEKQISSQPVRRRRKTLTAFFAWRREIKKRFGRLLGLWPKGGGRTHPRTGCTIPFCGQTSPKICAGMSAGEPEGKNLPVKRARPAAKPGFFPRKSRGRTVPGFSVSKNWLADSKLHKYHVPYGTSGHPREGTLMQRVTPPRRQAHKSSQSG